MPWLGVVSGEAAAAVAVARSRRCTRAVDQTGYAPFASGGGPGRIGMITDTVPITNSVDMGRLSSAGKGTKSCASVLSQPAC
jgi:hypothetical protein